MNLHAAIVVGDVASEGTEGGSNVITGILLNLSPRPLVVNCRYTLTALPVRRLDVSFTFSGKNLTGNIGANLRLVRLGAAPR